MGRGVTGFAGGRRLVTMGVRLAVLVLATVGLAVGQETPVAKPKVSDRPLTAEQLAVYRVVLHGWMDDGKQTVNLAVQTVPLETSGPLGAEDCEKGLELEPASPAVVHRFRKEDLSQLGSNKIGLVDPEKQEKEVAENDPEKTTRKGATIDEAVRNAFAHGLVTLSEIRFDKEHKLAIVSYGFLLRQSLRQRRDCGDGEAERRMDAQEPLPRLDLPASPPSRSGKSSVVRQRLRAGAPSTPRSNTG